MSKNIPPHVIDNFDDINRLLNQSQAVLVTLNSDGVLESVNRKYVKRTLWLVEELLSEISNINKRQWNEIKRSF